AGARRTQRYLPADGWRGQLADRGTGRSSHRRGKGGGAHMSQADTFQFNEGRSVSVRYRWPGHVLVAVALASLLLWATVFVRTPLAELPWYFAQRYFVLDATSMLFLLVINSVFLGISVYIASRVRMS